MSEQVYTFRKKPGRGAESWSLDGISLKREGGQSVDLASVVGGTFSDLPSGEQWVSCLVLEHSGGSAKIECRDARSGESRAQFLSLVVSVLGDLAVVSPKAAFRSGGGRAVTYALLAIGISLFGLGLYAMGGAILGLFGTATQFALSMGAMSLIFGIFLGWSGSPWSKPTTRSPQDLLEWLRTWLSQSSTTY